MAWHHGSRRRADDVGPRIQVHAADPHTFILRQSKSVHYEAPFLYLFCGNERALLLNTGATGDPADLPLRATVDTILRAWLAENPRQHYELVVAHSHAHGDHVAADAQFADRPDSTVVPPDLASVQAFFGFTTWPQQVGASTSVAGCSRSPAARPPPHLDRRPRPVERASSSPATRFTPGGSTWTTCRPSSPAWTGWWPWPAPAR